MRSAGFIIFLVSAWKGGNLNRHIQGVCKRGEFFRGDIVGGTGVILIDG